MVSALGHNDRYNRYISAFLERLLRVTAELIEMAQYIDAAVARKKCNWWRSDILAVSMAFCRLDLYLIDISRASNKSYLRLLHRLAIFLREKLNPFLPTLLLFICELYH